MKDIDKETQIPVLLSICSEQLFEGQEPDHIELITEGTLELLPDGLRFFYQETELTGMEGTTTRFLVRDDTVELTRTGGVNSQIVFQRGKRHSSLYETPWGMMLVDVVTTGLAHRLDSHGGLMEIQFNIAVDHQVTGQNRFKIRVREAAR